MASNFAKKLIKNHESLRFQVYDDADGKPIIPGKLVRGHPTIGIGRNLEKGLNVDECLYLFENDIIEAEIAIGNIFGLEIFKESEKRVAVLLDLAYNLGESRLRKFVKFIDAVKNRNWQEAGKELENSVWFHQVGRRAIKDIDLITKG